MHNKFERETTLFSMWDVTSESVVIEIRNGRSYEPLKVQGRSTVAGGQIFRVEQLKPVSGGTLSDSLLRCKIPLISMDPISSRDVTLVEEPKEASRGFYADANFIKSTPRQWISAATLETRISYQIIAHKETTMRQPVSHDLNAPRRGARRADTNSRAGTNSLPLLCFSHSATSLVSAEVATARCYSELVGGQGVYGYSKASDYGVVTWQEWVPSADDPQNSGSYIIKLVQLGCRSRYRSKEPGICMLKCSSELSGIHRVWVDAAYGRVFALSYGLRPTGVNASSIARGDVIVLDFV